MEKANWALNLVVSNQNEDDPLRLCVERALDRYFADLEGHTPTNLYEMVQREMEHPLLSRVMQYTSGNQTWAAEILGINRATLRKKLKQHDLG